MIFEVNPAAAQRVREPGGPHAGEYRFEGYFYLTEAEVRQAEADSVVPGANVGVDLSAPPVPTKPDDLTVTAALDVWFAGWLGYADPDRCREDRARMADTLNAARGIHSSHLRRLNDPPSGNREPAAVCYDDPVIPPLPEQVEDAAGREASYYDLAELARRVERLETLMKPWVVSVVREEPVPFGVPDPDCRTCGGTGRVVIPGSRSERRCPSCPGDPG